MTPGSTGSTSTAGRSTATTRRPASTSSVRHRDARDRWPSPPPRDGSSSRWRAGSGSSTGRRERGVTGSRSSRRASAIASTTGDAIRPVDSGSGRCSIRRRPATPRGCSIGSSRTGQRSRCARRSAWPTGSRSPRTGERCTSPIPPRDRLGVRLRRRYRRSQGRAGLPGLRAVAGPAGRGGRRRGRLLLDRLRPGRDGPPGHAGRGGRPADPRARLEADDAGVRWPGSVDPVHHHDRWRRIPPGRPERSPKRAASSRSSPVSAGCPSRGSAAARTWG